MEFEWDEDKWQENLQKRQVDFAVAARIFDERVIASEDRRRDYGERRFRAIGQFEGQAYVVAYTLRDQICHIITAWKVGPEGAKRYTALLAGRPPPDA